ncbi:serine hydrolase [Runella sp.]|uniref:serine hydrolase n=1 Tax=Runella sp. TaxID=1960881 RepID=UPI003D147FAB
MIRPILLLSIFTHFGFAQNEVSIHQKVARIDSFLTSLANHHLFNGSILVAEQGQIIYKKSAGYADFGRGIPNTDTTRFNLASLSKPFTAIAVLQLIQKGKLKLEDTFVTYFPDFPYPEVTIKHLLTQTSGVPVVERYEDEYIKAHPKETISNQTAYEHLVTLKKPLNFTSGNRWQYNNSNYFLLALLVGKVSQVPFTAYMKKNIFIPAGMKKTYIREAGMDNTTRYTLLNFYSPTYHNVDSLNPSEHYTYYHLGALTGSNNIISTLEDLWNFDNAFNAGKLISSALMETAFTPVTLNDGKPFRMGSSTRSYGLGWNVYTSKTNPADTSIFHDGRIVGLTTFLHRNLTKKQTVIFYDNTDNNPIQVMVSISNLLNGSPPLPVRLTKSLAKHYGEVLVTKGIDAAASTFNELKNDSTNYYVDELEMNRLGFDLLSAPFPNHNELSLEVFKINTLLYPKSGNTYDSYAHALAKSGKKEEAIAMYRKSIVLSPNNEDGKRALKALLEQKE